MTQAGYRLYDDAALGRLQTILLFRELQFPLKEIKAMLEHPDFDPAEALRQQIQLLELQKQRLDGLIRLAHTLQQEGFSHMDFHAYDKTKIDQYAGEVQSRWGSTEAYREYQQRGSRDSGAALMGLFAQLGQLSQLPPDAPEVQTAVGRMQAFITEHYYTCTKEIFAGLGQMYVQDPRFRQNIDEAGGEGTAAFAAEAIAVYCR